MPATSRIFGDRGAVLSLIGLSMFTVSETQYAIRKEFGGIVGTDYRPGLHSSGPGTR